MTGNYQGINDNCLPAISKPSLQQYDNYQIYDICCVDNWFEATDTYGNITRSEVTKQLSFLAIQAYSSSPISFDFIQLAEDYR